MSKRPLGINWDLTYACPLRCGHCYSESGRRPSRQLDITELARVANALIALQPESVHLSGGEPLMMRHFLEVAARFKAEGISLSLYTSGWLLDTTNLSEWLSLFSSVHVSLDGATPAVHDRLRGRQGSFTRALSALHTLVSASRQNRQEGRGNTAVGIDMAVMQGNFEQLASMCAELAAVVPGLSFVRLGAAVPSGLASRERFAKEMLLTPAQWRAMGEASLADALAAAAPPGVAVSVTDNRDLMLHPDELAAGKYANELMHVEPDGEVRGMPIYEGSVGNLLSEDPYRLWQHTHQRIGDPRVQAALRNIADMEDWARAVRTIDRLFAAPAEQSRLQRREHAAPLQRYA